MPGLRSGLTPRSLIALALMLALCSLAVVPVTATTTAQPPSVFQKADGSCCRAISEPCFLGIDPDVYQMPLFGEYIQSGDHLICATRNWSSYPPEAFNIDFMRAFWPQI